MAHACENCKFRAHYDAQPNSLFFQALTKFVFGLLLVGLLLFLPAGTFAYWQAWLFIGILFVPMFIAGIVLIVRQPELLRKRLDAKEQQQDQKWVVALSGLMFIAVFVVAGFSHRFGWYIEGLYRIQTARQI